jgi:hypothetical protein
MSVKGEGRLIVTPSPVSELLVSRHGLSAHLICQPLNSHRRQYIIMSLLAKLAPAKASSTSTSTTESVEVTIQTLSAPISGKFGNFRQFTMNGESYNVDDSRVFNTNVFKPNSKATLTIQEYINKEGVEKTIVAGLNIHLPEGSGLFIMK